MSHLRLVPKKGKELIFLKHWRTISLLNTDNKILAQALAICMEKVLPELISLDQNGYLNGHFIGLNIRTIIDCIELNTLIEII